MRRRRLYSGITPIIIAVLAVIGNSAQAQAPTAIQFFLPGGALPDREIRFTLEHEDGRIEVLLTGAKGRYQITDDLAREREFTITLEGDRRLYETTTRRLRITGNANLIPVFLRPLPGNPEPPGKELDVSVFDAKVSAEAKAAYDQAIKAASENNADGAISEFTRALSLYPRYLRALNDLGALYLKTNSLDEAVSTFLHANSLNSGYYFPRFYLGVAYNRQRKYDEAIRVLDRLVKDQPSFSIARIELAESLLASQQTDATMEQLRLALADTGLISSLRVDAHLKLGVLLNREERYASAVKEFEKVIAIDPKIALAHMHLGGALLNLNRIAEAEPTLKHAYELGGSNAAGAQLHLGLLYYMQKKYDLSQRAFEQYLKDVPNAQNIRQIRDMLEKIKAAIKQN